jgi:2,3-bisphosphoglycerate-independent phosphoglycerate mutase
LPMKYVLLVPDGFADDPLPEWNGKTPKMRARTPHLDALAKRALIGAVWTVPPDMYPGSDVANMAILGYDPRRYYTGRGPLEALAMGISLEEDDVAFRCSLISTDGERILDHSAGNISNEEAHPLIRLVDEKLGTRYWRFFPGVGYRHVMVWHEGPTEIRCTPPHDIVGEPWQKHLPQGEGEQKLRRLIEDSLNLLDDHPINRRRRDEGKMPANMIWTWGQGLAPKLPAFWLQRGVTGAVVAEVDLVKGIGRAAGLEVPQVPGATGYLHTDYRAIGAAALRMLEKHAFVFIHVEAPDEAGHQGDPEAKAWALEQIDEHIVAQLVDGLKEYDYRMLVLPDHATPVTIRTHRAGAVPFMLYDSREDLSRGSLLTFDESAVEETKLRIDEGWRLIDLLFKT